MCSVIFNLDNCDSQKVEKRHLISFNVYGLRRLLFKKRTYYCDSCYITIDSDANIIHEPFDMENLKVSAFDNLMVRGILSIEINEGSRKRTLFLPSKVVMGYNILQQKLKSRDNNLHIRCVALKKGNAK